jgi:pyruvate formate lyase activating enzyme
MHEGQRGLCFVRGVEQGEVKLYTYGRSSGFCVDPIEKKPLNHFLPGSSVLSFGTAGCNLACKFCQNWDMSKSREMDTLADYATPEMLASAARRLGCSSIAYTYNDPVIFMEYATDVADACRELGVKSVAVTAGYMCAEPRAEFFRHMDAANVDLKGFTERFYRKVCGAQLHAVLDTLQYLKHAADPGRE